MKQTVSDRGSWFSCWSHWSWCHLPSSSWVGALHPNSFLGAGVSIHPPSLDGCRILFVSFSDPDKPLQRQWIENWCRDNIANTSAKLLMSGLGVAPRDRYLPLDLPPGNGVVKISYQDEAGAGPALVPYRVSVYLEIEVVEND